jgi:benzylsuccinate CoA-transferase BbsF subunit
MDDAAPPLPLTGVRILDFTWVAAGPFGTMYLAMLGAECIRVGRVQDSTPGRRPQAFTHTIQSATSMEDIFVNKRSILVDLKQPEGVEIVKGLAKVCDAVAENFQPGTMERLGIGYAVLREANPGIVMLSQSTNGATGPDREDPGYAAIFAAMSGFGDLLGYEDGPPVEFRIQADLMSGTAGSFALLSALAYKRFHGTGQFVDSSNREMLSRFVSDALMDYMVNRRIQTRMGAQHVAFAPHNCYRCAGEGRWISIVVRDDEEWRRLALEVGGDGLASDERFADGFMRWRNREVLDELLGAWTSDKNDIELMHRLQAIGVAATPTMYPDDLFGDPHLEARDWWRVIDRGARGPYIMGGRTPWLMSETPSERYDGGHDPGTDTDAVLSELLGFDGKTIEDFRTRNVVA